MESKEKITRLMKAGFSLDEALDLIVPGTETEETAPAAEATQAAEAAPAAETAPAADPVISAIDDLKKTVAALAEVQRESARLFGVGERSTEESAEDILSKLG